MSASSWASVVCQVLDCAANGGRDQVQETPGKKQEFMRPVMAFYWALSKLNITCNSSDLSIFRALFEINYLC